MSERLGDKNRRKEWVNCRLHLEGSFISTSTDNGWRFVHETRNMSDLSEYLQGGELTKEQKLAIIYARTGRVEELGGVKVPMQAILDLAAQALLVPAVAEVVHVDWPTKRRHDE